MIIVEPETSTATELKHNDPVFGRCPQGSTIRSTSLDENIRKGGSRTHYFTDIKDPVYIIDDIGMLTTCVYKPDVFHRLKLSGVLIVKRYSIMASASAKDKIMDHYYGDQNIGDIATTAIIEQLTNKDFGPLGHLRILNFISSAKLPMYETAYLEKLNTYVCIGDVPTTTVPKIVTEESKITYSIVNNENPDKVYYVLTGRTVIPIKSYTDPRVKSQCTITVLDHHGASKITSADINELSTERIYPTKALAIHYGKEIETTEEAKYRLETERLEAKLKVDQEEAKNRQIQHTQTLETLSVKYEAEKSKLKLQVDKLELELKQAIEKHHNDMTLTTVNRVSQTIRDEQMHVNKLVSDAQSNKLSRKVAKYKARQDRKMNEELHQQKMATGQLQKEILEAKHEQEKILTLKSIVSPVIDTFVK